MTQQLTLFPTTDGVLDTLREENQRDRKVGCTCPVCDQYCRIWDQPLHSGMAHWLILLVNDYRQWYFWVSVKELSEKAGMRGGDYAKLRHWGLIVQATKKDLNNKRASGFWKPTKLGTDFVDNKIIIPRSILTYNKKHIGFGTETTTIREALGDKFDYDELINPTEGSAI